MLAGAVPSLVVFANLTWMPSFEPPRSYLTLFRQFDAKALLSE